MYRITFNEKFYEQVTKEKKNQNTSSKIKKKEKQLIINNNKIKEILKKDTFLLGKKIIYYGKNDFKKNYPIVNLKNYKLIYFIIEKYDDYLKNLVDNLKKENKIIICFSDYNDIKRVIIEKVNFDYLANPHINTKKQIFDFIHHFNSGLNHILAKLLKEKDKEILITLNQFFRSNITDTKNKFNIIKEIGRINQNLKLARKYKINLLFDFFIENENNLKTEREIKEIIKIFNISTTQINENTRELEKRYKQNIFKNSDNYITKGIEVI